MGNLQVAFLNVGQGDTIVVYDLENHEAVVIDCVNFLSVLDFLKSNHINRLRALVITHPHADHCSGATTLLENCERQGISWEACVFRWDFPYYRQNLQMFLSDRDYHSEFNLLPKARKSVYENLLVWANNPINKKKHIEPHSLPRDSHLTNALTFYHPEHYDVDVLFKTGSLNNLSYVIQIKDGVSVLLTGDIEPAGWQYFASNHPNEVANSILKFPHHGVWKGGKVSSLLEAVNPEYIVISVGSYNSYGHPSQEVLSEISKRDKIRVLCTQATLLCSSDINQSRESVLDAIEKNGGGANQNFKQSNGCPCSGTVIIELGVTPKVIWPTQHFHVTQIIQPFMKTHQCKV
jgi:beta-lactamase superfamily II metal-dependent hydrolase